MLKRGGIRMLVTAALVGVAAGAALPATAAAQLDGTPLDVMADGLGGIQIRQDGVADGFFYDPELNPGHAGLEIKEGGAYYPLQVEFDRAPGRTAITPPTLGGGGASKTLTSVYTVGPNLRVTETIAYTDNVPRVDVRYGIENVSAAPTSLRAGALADLYVGGNDSSFGVQALTPPRFVGGREGTTGLVYGLQEVTPWLAFQEGDYEGVFANFAAGGLNNLVDPAAPDNGVGAEFAVDDLQPGETRALDVRWLLAAPDPPGTVTPASPDGVPGAIAPKLEQLPPPVAGKTANVEVTRGTVLVQVPPSKAYKPLTGGLQIPLGAVVDARKGRVTLQSVGPDGKLQQATFYGGIFRVTQTRGAKPITDLVLVEALAKCPRKGKASAAAKKAKKRSLWGEGKGGFRTSGKYSSATIRGTKWLVEDTCAGTRTRVRQGTVLVRDVKRKRNVIVRAGKQYLARR